MNVIFSFKRASLVSAFVLLVGQALSSHAQTVLIDFGNNAAQYRGIPVPNPDPNGHYWNSVQPGLLYPAEGANPPGMIDFQNGATNIIMGWTTPVGTDSYNGPAGATDSGTLESHLQDLFYDPVALGNLGVDEAVFDFAASPITDDEDTRCRFNLQGLDPTKKYELTLFGSHSYSNDPTTVYSVFNDPTYANLIGTANLDVQDPLSPGAHNLGQVAIISDLSPGQDGILYVQFQSLTGNVGYINALQLVGTAGPGTIGDYNGDTKVDAADYTVWRNNLGTTTVLPNDPIGGTIGPGQYDNWKTNFGAGTGSGSLSIANSVPEPTTMLLCLLASVGAACLTRHHQSARS